MEESFYITKIGTGNRVRLNQIALELIGASAGDVLEVRLRVVKKAGVVSVG